MAGVLRAMLRDQKPYDPLRCMPKPIRLPPQVQVKRDSGVKTVRLAKATEAGVSIHHFSSKRRPATT
jgi:hypothetical protein